MEIAALPSQLAATHVTYGTAYATDIHGIVKENGKAVPVNNADMCEKTSAPIFPGALSLRWWHWVAGVS
jgi:hypothetical protein